MISKRIKNLALFMSLIMVLGVLSSCGLTTNGTKPKTVTAMMMTMTVMNMTTMTKMKMKTKMMIRIETTETPAAGVISIQTRREEKLKPRQKPNWKQRS